MRCCFVVGGEGSAKSGFCKGMRRIIDNSVILGLSLPKSKAEFSQQLMHHYFPIYDNVGSLSYEQQDMICRAITGEGFSKRELFSDEGDVIFNYLRPVGVNGLSTPGTKPDFLDRATMLKLFRIPNTKRLREKYVVAEQKKSARQSAWLLAYSSCREL